MRAMVFAEHGDESVLRLAQLPSRVPVGDEVRVRVEASCVNHIDLDIRAGTSRFDHPWPHTLGREAAGHVDAIGDATQGWRVGDRVLVDSSTPCGGCPTCAALRPNLCRRMVNPGVNIPGGYAEELIVPQAALVRIPPDVTATTATVLPVAFGTAWHVLVTLAGARRGERLLIFGASGGVGAAMIVVGRALDLDVLAVTRSAARTARLTRLGATDVITSRTGTVVGDVQAATNGLGADIAVDLVGGAAFGDAVGSVRAGGRVITVGAHAGEVVPVDLVDVFRREVQILGSRGHTRSELCEVIARLDTARLETVIDDVMPLETVADAHRRLDERAVAGKIVLSCG
jgi:NADPH:quinone reductase-like Zn-dependent oxidoreductase